MYQFFDRKKKVFYWFPSVLKVNVHIVYTYHVIVNAALCFQDVVVRVSFVLGNMTAKNEVARLRLFQEAGSFDILLSLFRFYLEQDVKVCIHLASALTILCIIYLIQHQKLLTFQCINNQSDEIGDSNVKIYEDSRMYLIEIFELTSW